VNLRSCNKITDLSVNTLLSQCPELTYLNLGYTQITDRAFDCLREKSSSSPPPPISYNNNPSEQVEHGNGKNKQFFSLKYTTADCGKISTRTKKKRKTKSAARDRDEDDDFNWIYQMPYEQNSKRMSREREWQDEDDTDYQRKKKKIQKKNISMKRRFPNKNQKKRLGM